jgi:hypothetical protein
MTTKETASVVLQLKAEREELKPLNRTVSHCLSMATDWALLAGCPLGRNGRRVPSTWGVRWDAFFWDSWDRSIRGEEDQDLFFEIAERIGGNLWSLEETEAANLLPGTVEEIIGRRTELFLPDYWLFVVHHLGWTGQLPYECQTRWKCGSTFADDPFSVTSRLPVNVVQASIDTLTVLIDAVIHDGGREATGTRKSGRIPQSPPVAEMLPWNNPTYDRAPAWQYENRTTGSGGSDTATALLPPRQKERHVRKRAERAANIESLKKELIAHIRAARDHAQAAVDFGREPELLPRPSQRELGERVGITKSAVCRCLSDPSATELNLLWKTADDLETVMRFVRP